MSDAPDTIAAAHAQPLANTTVLVAGAPPDLALRIARAARDRGATVGLATAGGHDEAAAEDIERFAFDVSTERDADRLFDDVARRFERVDVVILIVAVKPLPALHESSLEEWRIAVTDPLRQLLWLARRAVEEWLAAGGGARLVLVQAPPPDAQGNDVLDDALQSFVRSFAREYGRSAITCNAVMVSGSTRTENAMSTHDAIVECVGFLCSDGASFVTGEVLVVGNARSVNNAR